MSEQHESELEGGLGGKRHRRETLQIDRRALLDTRFGLTAKNLEDIGKRAVEIATNKDSSTREVNSATRNIMGMLAHLAQQDKQDREIPDSIVNVTHQTAIFADGNGRDVLGELLTDPRFREFQEWQRLRAIAEDAQSGELGSGGEQRPLEDGPSPGNGRSGAAGNGTPGRE